GTHQFQPVIYLKEPETVVGVAEELESFFYVFLYNSVCLLRNSLSDVQGQLWIPPLRTTHREPLNLESNLTRSWRGSGV
ncbi:uncharacterized protein BXZ73DRAFT_54971, partial [Epithele typhae]|uniref:uncharacterized protein n=1 Tax=Epithele typhae TaxID=378194 RepID=UPI002008A9AF